VLVTLPTNGVLTVSGTNAVIDDNYGINVLTYTSNDEECTAAYTDSFDYYVLDESESVSSTETVNLDANSFDCLPTATTFSETITQSGVIDFSEHVDDTETIDSNLQIVLVTLPTNGVLTESGTNAELDNAYGFNALTYTTNEECASSYSDSFTFYAIDEDDA